MEKENDYGWSKRIIAEIRLLSCLITKVTSAGSTVPHSPK